MELSIDNLRARWLLSLLISCCIGLFATAWPAAAELPVPPVARVLDQTATLTQNQIVALEQKLASFEKAKGSQIAVLIVPSTVPEAIEQFSIRVVEKWKLGRKGVDDGVLLLVAKNDRQTRIEVGYGLEGAITDLLSKRIIDQIIVPAFRNGNFYEGVDAGVDALIKVISGEELPAPKNGSGGSVEGKDTFPLFLIAGVLLGSALRYFLNKGTASVVTGVGVGVVASIFSGLIVGIIVGLFITFIVYGGIESRGGFYGGSSGGGGFGGGGFSGGGGGFGGGGASGRW